MGVRSSKNQQKAIEEYLSSFEKRQNADALFKRFIERVNSNAVKNDGTDELLKIIDEHVIDDLNSIFHKTISPNTKLYRARIVNPDNLKDTYGFNCINEELSGYDETNSREAPLGFSAEGRNNIKGISYLYVANRAETACAEIKPTVRQLISLAEFQVKEPLEIIDFSSDKTIKANGEDYSLAELFTKIMFMYTQPATDINEYRATQLLTDYLRKTGIDGISYQSYFDEKGINYTIFNSDHRKIKFISSRLLMFQNERKSFLDFNNEKVISATSQGGASYDAYSTKKMRQNIIVTIHNNNKDERSDNG